MGFKRGIASPVSFCHEGIDIACVVHGGDFMFVGRDEGLDAVEEHMKAWYEVKVKPRA